MSEISPTIPFHVARTYGTHAPQLASGRRTVVEARPAEAEVRQAPARLPSQTVTRLVAARVPGRIDFTPDGAKPSRPNGSCADGSCSQGSCSEDSVVNTQVASTTTLAFYRHPADKNAVATSIATAGALLDTLA